MYIFNLFKENRNKNLTALHPQLILLSFVQSKIQSCVVLSDSNFKAKKIPKHGEENERRHIGITRKMYQTSFHTAIAVQKVVNTKYPDLCS